MNMKKYAILLCALFLCACSSSQEPHEQTKKKAASTSSQTLQFKDSTYLNTMGDGNEDGYYHMKVRDLKDGTTVTNIAYYDYATRKEIYLCDKPECRHEDDTCTSYLNVAPYTGVLFTANDHLYFIDSQSGGMTLDGGEPAQTPHILQMDLDGKNRKSVYTLEDGYLFDDDSFAIAGTTLYHGVKKENIVDAGTYSLSTETEHKLYAIDLEHGTSVEECSLKYKRIIGADEHSLIFVHHNYETDPEEFLKKKDYEGYDQATLNVTMGYMRYDVTTHKEGKEIMSKSSVYASYLDHQLYYIDTALHAIDMDTGETRTVKEFTEGTTYSLAYLGDKVIVVEGWKQNAKGEATYDQSYAVSLIDGSMTPLSLMMKDPKEPARIMGTTSDSLLVQYDHDGHMEKSWAGTDQYEVDKEYIGLIKKEDYVQGKDQVLDIQTLE